MFHPRLITSNENSSQRFPCGPDQPMFLRVRPLRVALLDRLQAQHQHVEDDADVDNDNQ